MSVWSITVTELAPPAQGSRRSARLTHHVKAVDAGRHRVVNRDVAADEVATFDPDAAWREAYAARRR